MKDHGKYQHLKSLGTLMDTKFEGPYGIRFGLDALLGFLPIGGDVVTSGISLYIIYQAALLGCAPSTIIRMSLNVLWENLFDLIPFLGNFYDIYFKANTKNIALLEAHMMNPKRVDNQSRAIVFIIFLLLVTLMILSAVMTFYVLKMLFEWIGSF